MPENPDTYCKNDNFPLTAKPDPAKSRDLVQVRVYIEYEKLE